MPNAAEFQRRYDAYYHHMDELIKKHGWMVQGVFGTTDSHPSPSFYYTIGMLPLFGFELLIFALPPDLARQMLNDIGAGLRAGKPLEIGKPMDTSRWVHGNFPLLPVQCNTTNSALYDEYVRQAVNRHGKAGFPVVQLLLSDAQGRLPDYPDFDIVYMGIRQPRLDL